MASYYNMPEESTMLIVENVVFPVSDARYFNVTILNPSNSISDVNLTAIRLTVEGKNETYYITGEMAEPYLDFTMRKGMRQTFKCKRNWSDLAGETVHIEPIAKNVRVMICTASPPNVKLKVTPNFEEQITKSIKYFNLTIENLQPEPLINLTISEILFSDKVVTTKPLLPYTLMPNQNKTFICEQNWEELQWANVTMIVKTTEGYELNYVTNNLPGVALYIDEVKFDYADTSYFNLTLSSSKYSTEIAYINKVNLTLGDEQPISLNTSYPVNVNKTPLQLLPNQSLTLTCLWNWSTQRNELVTISVYTKQEFTVPSKTVTTPPEVVWNVTDVKFDLDDVEHFTVNITNMPCSLYGIKITNVRLNDDNATIINSPAQILPGEEVILNCSLGWLNYINKTATVTVTTEEGQSLSKIVEIDAVSLKLLGNNFVFGDIKDQCPNITISIPYVNITISNSVHSIQNVTINKIVLEVGNETYEIDGALTYPRISPSGYVLNAGENATIMCLWSWNLYLGSEPVKVTVYTAEGFQASKTFYP
jgi:hypothetical protein